MSDKTPAAPRATPRTGWLARLFGGRKAADSTTSDPALLLARDWLLARGGRVSQMAPDLVAGPLPDGTMVRFTSAPRRAREEPGVALLVPGTLEWAALQRDIADRAVGRVYRVRRAPEAAVALARAAFAPPVAGCTRCSESADVCERGPLCAACPLRQGRIVVAGTGEARKVTVEHADERLAREYAFRLRVTSARAEREEIVRVALDGASGEQVAPLDVALLTGAEEAGDAFVGGEDGDLRTRTRLAAAERLIESAVGAAGRLACAQALLEYQRRQDEVAATFERLLLEDPAAGRAALAAREQALARLAETHAIGVETQLVAAARVLTSLVTVRVQFGGGAQTRAEVDPCRGDVMARCVGCGGAWRVGARCGEGHVTCLACQMRCAHCGARRCAQCATAAYTSCAECGAAICAACARATAHGRHRVLAVTGAGDIQAEDASRPEQQGKGVEARSDELSVADLDSMTPSTWRECVAWLLAAMSYEVEGELDRGAPDLAYVCRAPAGEARQVVAVALRPGADMPDDLSSADLDRARRLAQRVDGARALLLTTARASGSTATDVEVVDRARLAAWLAEQRDTHQRARNDAAAVMDERATAAGRVRELLMDGLEEACARLAVHTGAPIPIVSDYELPRKAHAVKAHTVADRDDQLAAQAEAEVGTARQALAALETLIAQWESAFAPTATREGTQPITMVRDELDALAGRADHLLGVLRDASAALAAALASSSGSGALAEWRAAIRDEVSERCQALAARMRSLDPGAWREFAAVRESEAARASVAHEAAARRANARARGLRAALEAPSSRAQRGTRSAATRKRG